MPASPFRRRDRIASLSPWAVTDLMVEADLPKELFFGGLGLFTESGIPKAGYYALVLLARLGDQFLGKGDGWFAAKSEDSYQIILYNYRHFSRLYSVGERFDMTFTDRYTVFSPEQALDVHVILDEVPDGSYIVRETVVNRKYGSAFDKWLEMGALEPDTKQEFDTLATLSTPLTDKYLAKAEKHTLAIDAMLDMLEVRLITVSPV